MYPTSRRIGLSAAALAALLLAASAPAAWGARSEVATINTGLTARHAAVASDGGFVLLASGSAGTLSILDARSFTLAPVSLTLSSGGSLVKSVAAAIPGATPLIAVGTSNGKIEQWDAFDVFYYVDFAADGYPTPVPTVMSLTAADPIPGLDYNSVGTRLFAADGTNDSVSEFDTSNASAVSGGVVFGHTPLNALDVRTDFVERVFFGTNDGYLAWIDTATLNPVATNFDNTFTHDYPALAAGTFSTAVRIAMIDADSDSLLLIDPAGPTLVDSIGLPAHPTGVAISGSGSTARIWVAEDDSTGGANQVEAYDESLALSQTAIPLSAAPVSATEGNGWLYVGLSNGSVSVITDHPYLDITSVTPNPVEATGTDVDVTFTSTETGNANVLVNGASVTSVSVPAASTAVTVTLDGATLDGLLFEGSNELRIEQTGSTSGLAGHDQVNLKQDLPPPTPSGFSVGFGDGRVIGTWDAIDVFDVPDFKDYVVRFGTTASGTNGVATMVSPQRTTGTSFAVTVSNGTTVFMSVMAEDSAGNLSAPSAVLSATAQQTAGAADLAGDDGGFMFNCRVGPAGGGARALASALGAAFALLLMRGFFRGRSRRYPQDSWDPE